MSKLKEIMDILDIVINQHHHTGKWYVFLRQKGEGLYLWPDFWWRTTAWMTGGDHAYYATREEAEGVLKEATSKKAFPLIKKGPS